MIGLELIVRLKGMEFKEVAKFLEISPQTVSDWVKAKRKVPFKRAIQLSNFFNVDVDLIGKELETEDEMKIYYSLGKLYDGLGIRKELQEDYNEEDESMFSEQSALISDDTIRIKNVGTIKELEDQVFENRKYLKTEILDISVTELMNMYAVRKVLDFPEFQRNFGWTIKEKTKLIESILLGMPIPPLVIAIESDGRWEVIDGVQRLSTIFEFLGVLLDEYGEPIEPSVLEGAEILKALEGKVWSNEYSKHKHRFSLKQSTKIATKFLYAPLKVLVVGDESNTNVKYEIFNRLNITGRKINVQEARNYLAISLNRKFYIWLKKLSLNPNFINSLPLSEDAMKKQVDIEYVLRFIVYRNIKQSEYGLTSSLQEVITEKMQKFCLEDSLDYEKEKEVFDKTFELLNASLGMNSFKKYYENYNGFRGLASLTNFEIIAIGIAHNLDYITGLDNPIEYINNKVKELYSSTEYIEIQNIISGRAITRFTTLTELGKKYFSY